MELYFLDDGSLIIDTPKSIQLIDQVEIVRTVGSHRLSGLSGKEAFDILVKNGLSSSEEPIRTRDREDKYPIREDKCPIREIR